MIDIKGVKGDNILNKKQVQMLINEKEKRLLELVRSTGYGELKVVIQDALPIRVEELKKSIKL
jgi:hydrogenase maturation factor HypE